jgi:hypothetical protein
VFALAFYLAKVFSENTTEITRSFKIIMFEFYFYIIVNDNIFFILRHGQ